MDIALIKETAAHGHEHRVLLLPEEVHKITLKGYRVFVESGAGKNIDIEDRHYSDAGAKILSDRNKLFKKDMVVKLKAPTKEEFKLLKNNLLFSMLHAEQNTEYVNALREQNARAIAIEMIRNAADERVVHCSDMAGEQGMLMAFHHSLKSPSQCRILVLGYGVIASGALKIAYQLGANVKILRRCHYPHIRHYLKNKDILVNGISWPKEKRDKKEYLVTKDMLQLMSPGAIVLDLSVDYPNPIQTCHPTYLDKPFYTKYGVKHICIYGYPGLVPISSSKRYSRQVLPLILKIASTPLEKLPSYIKQALVC